MEHTQHPYGEQRPFVACTGCGQPTFMTGTRHCDGCHAVLPLGEEAVLAMFTRDYRVRQQGGTLQHEMLAWAVDCFGDGTRHPQERALRLLEEAVEAAQAVGITPAQAERVVARTYSRGVGEITQELGGVALTLMAFAQSLGVSTWGCLLEEMRRVRLLDKDKVRAKHAEKVAAGTAL